MYTEGIISRLNNPNLKKKDNHGRIVLDGTIGEWLEHYTNHFLDLFVSHTTGDYLDLLGREVDVVRADDEFDNSYRKRILTELNLTESSKDFIGLSVRLWVYDEDVYAHKDYLTSRNPYLKKDDDNTFLAHSDIATKNYLKNKFLTSGVVWF